MQPREPVNECEEVVKREKLLVRRVAVVFSQ
jgi:hypothetical protein